MYVHVRRDDFCIVYIATELEFNLVYVIYLIRKQNQTDAKQTT